MLGRHGAELGGRQILQRTAETAEPGTHARQEDDVFIGTLGFHGGKLRVRRGEYRRWEGTAVGREVRCSSLTRRALGAHPSPSAPSQGAKHTRTDTLRFARRWRLRRLAFEPSPRYPACALPPRALPSPPARGRVPPRRDPVVRTSARPRAPPPSGWRRLSPRVTAPSRAP